MSKHEREIYEQYRELNRNGWNIQDTNPVLCRSNGGSETLKHAVAKTIAGKVCENAGYRVQSEVETDHGKEADILAFGHESRRPIVVELENSLTEEVRNQKLSHYLKGQVREVYVIDLDQWGCESPGWFMDHVKQVTGL